MRNLFQRNRRTLLLLAVLALSFSIISSHLSTPAGTGSAGIGESLAVRLITPFQRGVSSLSGIMKIAWYNYIYLVKLKEKNDVMSEKLNRIEGEVARLREKAGATERLAALLGFKESHSLELRVARLIGFESGGYNRTVTLDKGSADGVGPNMPVVNAQGVVGRVVKAFGASCQVLLVVDYNSAIDAVIQRTRDKGIVVGLGGRSCEMKYVDRQSDVQAGDTVVTSGLNAGFPPGLIIGEVSRVQKEGAGLFQDIEVRPAVDMDQLEEVFIVLRERP
jgi:rod shape-determining protein MreC